MRDTPKSYMITFMNGCRVLAEGPMNQAGTAPFRAPRRLRPMRTLYYGASEIRIDRQYPARTAETRRLEITPHLDRSDRTEEGDKGRKKLYDII